MTDTRVRVPLNGKTVDLAALDAETGGYGLFGGDEEVGAIEGSPVTGIELAAAVAAHVPPLAPPTVGEQISELVDAVSVLTDLVLGV